MAYEMVMPYHLHMPSYFLETFTEYPEQDFPQPGTFRALFAGISVGECSFIPFVYSFNPIVGCERPAFPYHGTDI